MHIFTFKSQYGKIPPPIKHIPVYVYPRHTLFSIVIRIARELRDRQKGMINHKIPLGVDFLKISYGQFYVDYLPENVLYHQSVHSTTRYFLWNSYEDMWSITQLYSAFVPCFWPVNTPRAIPVYSLPLVLGKMLCVKCHCDITIGCTK